MATEEAYIDLARLRGHAKGTVVLCDRGAVDGKTFIPLDQWELLLKEAETSDQQLLARYEVVVHMVTAAVGAGAHYEFGPGSKNPERYHDAAEAAEADRKGQDAYSKHPKLMVIDNSTGFKEKVSRTLQAICQGVGLAQPRSHTLRRRVFGLPDCELRRHVGSFGKADIWVHTLTNGSRIEKREQTGLGTTYKRKHAKGEQMLTKGEWEIQVQSVIQQEPVHKAVRSFQCRVDKKDYYWELLEFFDASGKERSDNIWALEVETWSPEESVPTPNFLQEIASVNSNPLLLQLPSQSPSISQSEAAENEERATKRPCLRPSANPVGNGKVVAKAATAKGTTNAMKSNRREGGGVLLTDFFKPKGVPPAETDQIAIASSKERHAIGDDMYDDSPDRESHSPEHHKYQEQEMASPLAFTQQATAGH